MFMLLYQKPEGQCKDHKCTCEIQGIRSCKELSYLTGSFFLPPELLSLPWYHKRPVAAWGLPAYRSRSQHVNQADWLFGLFFFFFHWVFVPEGMCCNYLHSPYLFTFNWNTEIVLKLSLSVYPYYFSDVCLTSGWTNDTGWSGSEFKPSLLQRDCNYVSQRQYLGNE